MNHKQSFSPRRPVVGVIGNRYMMYGHLPCVMGTVLDVRAIAALSGALPLVVPSDPQSVSVSDVLDSCDGFLLTGGRANVHPRYYGVAPTAAHGRFDSNRDRLVLPLIRACLERGQPILGICRGFQEINVALGGTLHAALSAHPQRLHHGMPPAMLAVNETNSAMPPHRALREKFSNQHKVFFTENGVFARLFGQTQVITNSLHGQGINHVGTNVVIDGVAADNTPEALYVDNVPGFALAVQWHPEWRAQANPYSRALFSAFGAALQAWQKNECFAHNQITAPGALL